MNNINKLNCSINFCRFVAIMCVVMHHYCGRPGGGYLAVDFFSLLTGFFLMQHFIRNDSENTTSSLSALKYTFSRYLRLLPYYFVAFILRIFIQIFVIKNFNFLRFISDNLWEILMIDGFGITTNLVVGPGWYLQAMLLSGFIIYFLLKIKKDYFTYFISPLVFLFMINVLVHKVGHLNYWMKPDDTFPLATFKVFAEMGFGCTCFEIYRYLKEKLLKLSKIKRLIIHSAIEAPCIAYIFYVVFFHTQTYADFISLLFMSTLIVSLYMESSVFSMILNNKISLFLGKITIAIYLLHIPLASFNWGSLPGLSWKAGTLLYLAVLICISSLTTLAIESLHKKDKHKSN